MQKKKTTLLLRVYGKGVMIVLHMRRRAGKGKDIPGGACVRDCKPTAERFMKR
jgi:hypothetical protein